jgi:hypothetical protein
MTTQQTTTTSSGTMTFSQWEETPAYGDEAPLPRLAQAEVTFTYAGDLVGTGECRYLFRYGPDGECQALGFEHVTGALRGREGSFALRHEGVYGAGGLEIRATIVPGSGTEQLEGLTGGGTVTAPAGEKATRYRFEHTA